MPYLLSFFFLLFLLFFIYLLVKKKKKIRKRIDINDIIQREPNNYVVMKGCVCCVRLNRKLSKTTKVRFYLPYYQIHNIW